MGFLMGQLKSNFKDHIIDGNIVRSTLLKIKSED